MLGIHRPTSLSPLECFKRFHPPMIRKVGGPAFGRAKALSTPEER
jgi:hypothetical protein